MKIFTSFLLFSLLTVAFAQNAPESSLPPLRKIAGHVYGYYGTVNASPTGNSFGANCGVVIGDDAVLVVDTLTSAKFGEKLLADIRKITDKPVKYVVNTHYHLDHAWGNAPFKKAGACIIAQNDVTDSIPRARKTLENPASYGFTKEDLAGTEILNPDITFSENLTVNLGSVSVYLEFPGPTHTSSSITAYVKEDKVLFTGDILFKGYHPFIGEGEFSNWIKVLDKLAERYPDAVFVPGHGPLAAASDLKDMKAYIIAFDALAQEHAKGKTAADLKDVAAKIKAGLPEQGRKELPGLIDFNLMMKYLPPAPAK